MNIVKNIKNLLSVRFALLCCLVGTAGPGLAENKVHIENFSIVAGETKTVTLNLNTDLGGLKTLEGYIVMPAGLEVQNQGSEASKKWIKYDNSRVSVAVAQMNPATGQMKITGVGALISDGTGSVATIVVKATDELADGSLITLSGFKGKDKDGNEVEIASENATVSLSVPDVKTIVTITPSSLCLLPDGEALLEVQLENSIELTGLQATIEVSEGLALAGAPETTERVDVELFLPNLETMTCYILGTVAAGKGTVLTVPVKAAEGFAGGSVRLTNIVATTGSAKACYLEDAEVKVDLGDGIIVISKDGADTNVSVDETKGTPKAGIIADGLVAKSFSYKRTLPAGQACTVCLPYAPPTAGVKYYELTGAEGETLSFTEVASPAAATPYLAVAETATDITPADIANVTLTQAVTGSSAAGGYTLKGTLTGLANAEAASAGAYILQAGGVWKKVTTANTDAYIPPFRGYIVGGSAARLGTVIAETTAIENLRTVDLDGTEHWYDLGGRSIAAPARRGIYIVNGKKIIK